MQTANTYSNLKHTQLKTILDPAPGPDLNKHVHSWSCWKRSTPAGVDSGSYTPPLSIHTTLGWAQ